MKNPVENYFKSLEGLQQYFGCETNEFRWSHLEDHTTKYWYLDWINNYVWLANSPQDLLPEVPVGVYVDCLNLYAYDADIITSKEYSAIPMEDSQGNRFYIIVKNNMKLGECSEEIDTDSIYSINIYPNDCIIINQKHSDENVKYIVSKDLGEHIECYKTDSLEDVINSEEYSYQMGMITISKENVLKVQRDKHTIFEKTEDNIEYSYDYFSKKHPEKFSKHHLDGYIPKFSYGDLKNLAASSKKEDKILLKMLLDGIGDSIKEFFLK